LQSVAVAAFRIVSWNKDVIVELVLIFPLPIILIPQISNTYHQVPILQYLAPLTRPAEVSGRPTLRSTATNHLVVSSYNLLNIDSQGFYKRGGSHGGGRATGAGDEVPQKLKQNVKLVYNF